MTINIGSAILILGCLYFGYLHGFDWWLVGLIIMGALSWNFILRRDQDKRKLEAQIELLKSEADYYRRKELR